MYNTSMSVHNNSLLVRIRGTLVKSAAMEWVPDGRGGGSYRDLRSSGSGPVVLGQRPAVSRGSAGTRRWDQDLANEALAHRQAMRDGSWLSTGHAARMREAGRSQASAQTNANLQEIRQLAAKYKMSPQLQQYLMRNPQELAKLRTPTQTRQQSVSAQTARPAASGTQIPTPARPVQQPVSAPARPVQQPAVQSPAPVQQPAMRSPAPAAQSATQPSNPLVDLLRQGRITQQEFDAASDPNRPRGGSSPLFRLYQQGKLSRRDFDRMTVRPQATPAATRPQSPAPAASASGQTTAGLGFGITDADLPKPLGSPAPVKSPAAKQYAAASKNFATGQVAQTAQQPNRQLGQGGGQTPQSTAGKTVTTCPTCGGSGKKIAESALPAAPKIPNPAPQPLKTPSFTTKPPTVGRAVADVRPGLPGAVTPKTQALGTAKATGAKQTTVSTPIMTPKEFKAIPAVPLAKTAQSIAFGGGTVPQVDTRNWTKDDWKRYAGMAVGAPFVAASLPAVATAGSVGAAASALGGAAVSGLGGYNAGTSAFDAADSARHGDYGAAARHGAETVLSAGFGLAGKVPKALSAAKGAAGVLAGTDLARAGVYAANGMPEAAGAAASGAAGDLAMFIPGGRLSSRLLSGLGLYGVSPVAKIYEQSAAADALAGKELGIYAPAADKAEQAARSVFDAHGVDSKPYADAISESAADAVTGAYDADTPAAAAAYAGRSWTRKLMSGLLGTDALDAVKAREGLVRGTGAARTIPGNLQFGAAHRAVGGNGLESGLAAADSLKFSKTLGGGVPVDTSGLTPGGVAAVRDVASNATGVAPAARAVQDYQASWRGKLGRALGWAGRNKGLLAAGTGAGLLSLLAWRALANRRKKRQAEKTVS